LVISSDDPSSRVRQAVAAELAGWPSVESSLLMEQLLQDRSPSVQAEAVNSISAWPNELALRLLLHGLEHCTLKNRQQCFKQLRGRVPEVESFPIDADPRERTAAVRTLASRLNDVASHLDRLQRDGLAEIPRTDTSRRQEIESWLGDLMNSTADSPIRASAREHLLRLEAADVAHLEQLLLEHQVAGNRFVYYELLPRLTPIYGALVKLESSDVFVRRAGAETLARKGATASLSSLVTRRLGELMAREQDEPVWREVMGAVLNDGSQDAAQLSLLAINHRWPDVRTLGCRYVSRHPSSARGTWVLPLLDDPNRQVQLAAIESAGRCHNPIVIDGTPASADTQEHPGLVALLSEADDRVCGAAAVSLSRLGDARGMQELVRISYDESPARRRETAAHMGETGRTRFVEHLIRMGHTEQNTQVQKAILESLDRLVPQESRPTSLESTADSRDRITRWVAWSQQQSQIR
jgi:HEAT repeat protein